MCVKNEPTRSHGGGDCHFKDPLVVVEVIVYVKICHHVVVEVAIGFYLGHVNVEVLRFQKQYLKNNLLNFLIIFYYSNSPNDL